MLIRRSLTPSTWEDFDRLQQEMNRLFESYYPNRILSTREFPAMNLWSNEEGIYISSELPGVNADDLEVKVVDETLTLSGIRRPETMDEGIRYHRQERGYGKFTRTIQLPFPVNADRVDAILENGVLRISLPRAEADKPKKISVKTS
jgi:HSP20 family protein